MDIPTELSVKMPNRRATQERATTVILQDPQYVSHGEAVLYREPDGFNPHEMVFGFARTGSLSEALGFCFSEEFRHMLQMREADYNVVCLLCVTMLDPQWKLDLIIVLSEERYINLEDY